METTELYEIGFNISVALYVQLWLKSRHPLFGASFTVVEALSILRILFLARVSGKATIIYIVGS